MLSSFLQMFIVLGMYNFVASLSLTFLMRNVFWTKLKYFLPQFFRLFEFLCKSKSQLNLQIVNNLYKNLSRFYTFWRCIQILNWTMVIFLENCTDLLWEKHIFANFEITIHSNSERLKQFLKQNIVLLVTGGSNQI